VNSTMYRGGNIAVNTPMVDWLKKPFFKCVTFPVYWWGGIIGPGFVMQITFGCIEDEQ